MNSKNTKNDFHIQKIKKELSNLDNGSFDIKKCDKILDFFSKYDYQDSIQQSTLELIKELKSKLNYYFKSKIISNLKTENYENITYLIILAVQTDIKNISYIEYIEQAFIDKELFTEIIELYKIIFLYYPEEKYLEKIGDIYLLANNLPAAIDSFLNAAEISTNNISLYQKLANIFDSTGDTESKNICLEQIQKLKEKK